MRKFHRILTFLKIQPGEERLIGLLISLAFVLELAFVLVQSMAFGVFLAEYGPQGFPYSYITIAIFASLAAVLYIKVGQRVSFFTALMINLSSLGIFSILVWVGLKSTLFHYIAFILPLHFQIVINFGVLVVWQLAGRLLDLQQAKRLYPLVSAGSWLANIIGGLLILPLVQWMGAINLLVPAAIVIGLAMLVLRTITRSHPIQESSTPQAHRKTSIASSSKGSFQNRYAYLIFAFITIWWMAFFFLDNIFADRVAARFTDVDQLTAFRGQLLSMTGIVALLTSIFLTTRIIKRFGLRAGLFSEALTVSFILGLLVTISGLGGSMVVVFYLVVIAKLVNVALGFSVSQSAYNMLYQPMHETVRGKIQATAEGVFQPIASGLAGLSLLVLTSGLKFNYLGLSYVNLGIAILVVVIIVMLSNHYVKALTQAITKRRLGELPAALIDPAAIKLLRGRLSDLHPGVVLYALNQLETDDQQTIIAELPKLIEHPAAEVRREALMRVEELKLRGMLHQVQKQLSIETSSSVKESALRALAAIVDDPSLLIQSLNDTDVHCLRGGLTGLLMYGNEPKALQKLNELLTSTSSNGRNLAIEVLGKVNRREFYPYLIAACDSPETHRSAGFALISIGADALPEIESAFGESEAPRLRLLTLVKVLGRIGGTSSHALLRSKINSSDGDLRSQVLDALRESGYRVKDQSEIFAAIRMEIQVVVWICAAQVELGNRNETVLLSTALQQHFNQARDRVLLLLSLTFDSHSILRAREAFLGVSTLQLAYALEIVDAQLPSDWKPMIMPVLDNLSPRDRLQNFVQIFPQALIAGENRLCTLIDGSTDQRFSDWIRACAIHTASRIQVHSCHESIWTASTDSAKLIRDTACWALTQLSINSPEGSKSPCYLQLKKFSF